MTKLKAANAKLGNPKKKPATTKPPEQDPPDELEQNRLKRMTFVLDDAEIKWLKDTVKDYKAKPTLSPVTMSRLIRLGIRLLQEKDLSKLLN